MIKSPNEKYGLLVKYDGTLELSHLSNVNLPVDHPFWSAKTVQPTEYKPLWWTARLQGDGRLQMLATIRVGDRFTASSSFFSCSGDTCSDIPYWSAGPAPAGLTAPYYLRLQDNGDLVLMDSEDVIYWNSGTAESSHH